MSVAPLFVASLDALKAKLRLSGAQADAKTVIEDAVQRVRVGFFDSLGSSRISAILATTEDSAATTASGIMRLRATTTEVAWVRMYLLRTMPVLFKDGSANLQQTWNEEGLARTAGSTEIDREISRLDVEVKEGLESLQGEAAPDNSAISTKVIGPACKNTAPGSFIYQ